MKNETPCVERFLKVASSLRNISVLLIAVPLLLSPAAVSASNGAIRFHGQVINPACSVQFSRSSIDSHSVRVIKVTDAFTLQVDKLRDVCGGEIKPFSVSYQPLPEKYLSSVITEMTGLEPAVGIITLTYQ
ncbi:MAG: hypothetical protein ABWY17_12130 [Pseudomonas sp.]